MTDHSKAALQSTEDLNFRPFTVLLGIISGSVIAITFGLAVVGFVFWVLKDESPRLLAEMDSLITNTAIFFILSIFAGCSFFGSLRGAAWRHVPMALLWCSLLLAGRYYWPQ